MEAYPDFKEFLQLLNAHNVEYLIVGAYALAYHGAPRFTGDIDIYIRPEKENAERLIKVLADFGFPLSNLTTDDFTKPDHVVQLGLPPVRIDILTSITGVSWEQANHGKLFGKYGDVPVCFLGKKEYITNKRATGRTKDLADIEAIEDDCPADGPGAD